MARRLPSAQGQHDTAIGKLAALWANPTQYNITMNPDGEKNRWVGSSDCFPDLVAWTRKGDRDQALWIVEVETTESVNDDEARAQWSAYARSGVPLSLAVPTGSGARAWAIANQLGIALNKVLEFSNEYGQIQVTETPRPESSLWTAYGRNR
jgi:hypothetical protein